MAEPKKAEFTVEEVQALPSVELPKGVLVDGTLIKTVYLREAMNRDLREVGKDARAREGENVYGMVMMSRVAWIVIDGAARKVTFDEVQDLTLKDSDVLAGKFVEMNTDSIEGVQRLFPSGGTRGMVR